MRTSLSVWTVRLGISLTALFGVFPYLGAQELLPNIPVRKLNLQECIALGMEHQPALAAARASLAAAESGQRGLYSIGLARFLAPDLKIRKQQGCLGIQIAQANLFQAEWETRYAVTRNYYSVVYARLQGGVVKGLVDKLDRAVDKAKLIVKSGEVKLVTQIDVDTLTVNRDFYKSREYEAVVGIERAQAALREAIGVNQDYALETSADTLPALTEDLKKEELIAVAVAQRGEMTQAQLASRVTELEIQAQGRIFGPSGRTFALGSDLHAKPIPQGVANGEYRPGALGLEMPVNMAGHKRDRMQRARDFNDRAGAVVEKTENLIALEVEAAYLKWKESAGRAKSLFGSIKLAQKVADNTRGRFDNGNVSGEELIRATTLEDQVRVNYNDALYNHALAIAALERVTAGGFQFPQKQP